MARAAKTPAPKKPAPKAPKAAKPVAAKAPAPKAAPVRKATSGGPDIWIAAGVRTPFARVGGALAKHDALELSVPVIKAMTATGIRPDVAVWGTVIPNLTWSNLAREAMLQAGADPTIPAYSVVMACSTSMMGAITAAGMLDDRDRSLALVGGSESMSRIQIGLSQTLSDKLRMLMASKTMSDRVAVLKATRGKDLRLFIPKVENRVTGKSMGQHTEEMAQDWGITREAQDAFAMASHQNAAAGWKSGFFDDLVIKMDEIARDGIVRGDSNLEKLAKLKPVFDRGPKGTITAGNASPLTDGAAAIWVASTQGLKRLPAGTARARLVDYEVSSIDLHKEHLLMAPAYSIPRLLARNGLTYADISLWEIHEAFAAQVLTHVKALNDPKFVKDKVGVSAKMGQLPAVETINPNGGSTALGHPFGATGARILSQAVKELARRPKGAYAIVSICADGGLGTVALLRNS